MQSLYMYLAHHSTFLLFESLALLPRLISNLWAQETLMSQVWWHMPVIAVYWEAEARGS